MDYEEIFDSFINDEEITDEEYGFILNIVLDKIVNGEELECYEQWLIYECGAYKYEEELVEACRRGWVKYQIIYKIKDSYYMGEMFCHDDYGCDWESLETKVLPKVKKVEYTAYRWEKE